MNNEEELDNTKLENLLNEEDLQLAKLLGIEKLTRKEFKELFKRNVLNKGVEENVSV